MNQMRRQVHKLLTNLLFLNHSERMVWLDETGYRTHMTRTDGWAPVGQRLHGLCRHKSSPYTQVCAISRQGVLATQVFPDGMTLKRWKTYVRDVLLPALEPGRLIFLDNLETHYDQEVLQWIEDAGHVVFFTPPYSPEGNPIEYLFSKLKLFVRKQAPRGAAQLRQAIKDGLDTVTLSDIASYFFVSWGHVLSWN